MPPKDDELRGHDVIFVGRPETNAALAETTFCGLVGITHHNGHFLVPAQHMPVHSPEASKQGPDRLGSPSWQRR